MLKQINLDDERFQGLVERAQMSVAEYLPAWNDLNTHDPGVMLIELLAWLTEAQRFHMNRSSNADAFLPLLGVTPHHTRAAEATVFFAGGTAFSPPAGTPVMAEDVRFETVSGLYDENALRVAQRHTLFEDIDCGLGPEYAKPGTYLSANGETTLFYKLDGLYTQIADYKSVPPGARLRAVSCERESARFRVLGVAEGFPNQRFPVDTRGQHILADGFTLLIAIDQTLSMARKWTLVDNFRASGPADTHYVLDYGTNEVVFGDGIRGMMPEGVVFLSALAVTHGRDGNITSGQLTALQLDGNSFSLIQPMPASGGTDRESAADTIARFRSETRQAVTAKDIEELAMETPGIELERVKAFAPEAERPRVIHIAAKPKGGRARLSDSQRRQIELHLEPYRLAGYRFTAVSPNYAAIHMSAEIYALRHDAGFAHALEDTLRRFFNSECSGFDAHIKSSDFASLLSREPDIIKITRCDIRTYSAHAHTDSHGDITVAVGALAYLDTLRLRVVAHSPS